LEVPDSVDATFDPRREPPAGDERASVPAPVPAEADDKTPKLSDSVLPVRSLPVLIADLSPSVVLVKRTRSYGSGFVVGEGIVATNYHVIAGGGEAEVRFKDGTLEKVLGTLVSDEARDLALLRVDTERVRLKPLPVSVSVPERGEAVFALGYPLGLIGEITPTDGIISAKRSGDELCAFYEEPRGTFLGTWIQTTAAINHGNSGGPLLDMRGQVVGMSTLIGFAAGERERADGINFVISGLDLVDALETAKSAAVTPLPKETSPTVAAGDSTDGGASSASDWLQPVTTSEKFLWSLPAGSFYINGDRELHQFTSPQREWGRIVGFTIDSILVQFENSKAIGYVRLINLGSQIRTVGAHMRLAEADLRRHDAASDADLLSERWKQSQRGMITHGAILDGKDRQHRIDTGTNIRPPGPTATQVWYDLMIQRLGFGQ
jgi:S1-C subfamily serine protease